jgi:membrane protein implicated in regulation of membrane protease activity
MIEWMQSVDYWHWWVLAIILIVLEVFSPAAFFLWLGVAAGIVGVFVLIEPGMFWDWQIGLFAVFSVVSTVIGRRLFVGKQSETDHPRLNRRGEQYIDRTFTLDEPVINGTGKIKVDDTTWKITGNDMPAGTKVRVIGVDGVVLKIESA